MEESGHYYTVYFTSLAVGFSNGIALRQATLAQMPDQVKGLDATHLHLQNCLKVFKGNQSAKANEWRFLVEYVLHSLPDIKTGNISSSDQSAVTRNLLLHSRPYSLEFGLLLHRLGDTYAHRRIHSEGNMYGTSKDAVESCSKIDYMGHFIDWHEPDYPFARANLFCTYLEELYGVLHRKCSEKSSLLYRRNIEQGKILSKSELISIFRSMLDDVAGYGKSFRDVSQFFFIQRIREQCQRIFGITMSSYAPEEERTMTFDEFIKNHTGLGIDKYQIKAAIHRIAVGLEKKFP